MSTLDHFSTSRSHGMHWLVADASVPYGVKTSRRDATIWSVSPDWTATHPIGTSHMVINIPNPVVGVAAIAENLTETVAGDSNVAGP